MSTFCNFEAHRNLAGYDLDCSPRIKESEWSFLQGENFADFFLSGGPALLIKTQLLHGRGGAIDVKVSADILNHAPELEASHNFLLRTSECIGWQRNDALVVEAAVVVGPIRSKTKPFLLGAILDALNEGRELLLDEVRGAVETPCLPSGSELVGWIHKNHPSSAELLAMLVENLKGSREPHAPYVLEQIQASKAVFAQ